MIDLPARVRRRRMAAAAGLVALLGGGGALALMTAGGGSGRAGDAALPPGLERLAGGGAGHHRRHARASRLAALSARLPLERQVSQLFVIGLDARQTTDPGFAWARTHDWGGVVLDRPNFVDQAQLGALTAALVADARRAGHLPPLLAAGQEGGDGSAFPGLPPRAQPKVGATGRPAVAAAQARAAARELHALGVQMTLAPVADVGAQGGGVEDRVFGDDPATVAAMTLAAADSYQQAGIAAAVGHFPGEGAASQDPEQGTATIGLDLAELRRRDLVPFRAIARRVPVIVVSDAVYAAYDGVSPAVLLPPVIDGLLRRELRFDGVVMSSDLASAAPAIGKDVGTVAVDALRSGADLLYVAGGTDRQAAAYDAVLRAVRSGHLPRARLETALLRVLALKRRYGVLGGAA